MAIDVRSAVEIIFNHEIVVLGFLRNLKYWSVKVFLVRSTKLFGNPKIAHFQAQAEAGCMNLNI